MDYAYSSASVFLVGRKWGTLVSSFVFSVCIYIVYQQINTAEPAVYTTGALLNVIEVSIAHILLFRFYERSRASAYQQLYMRSAEIVELSQKDKLTNLFNRDRFDTALKDLLSTDSPASLKISMIMLDIDHFKGINDKHGHLVGDKVLTELSKELSHLVRKHDLLARWGGEEFVILLHDTSTEVATELAERLRKHVQSTLLADLSISISLGLTSFVSGDTIESMMGRADKALYQAKHQGRNRVSVVSK